MKDHGAKFVELVDNVRRRINECTVADVATRQEREESFHLIDVREESEWAAGHVPGALHLGKGIIERDIEEVFPDTTAEIILYCGGGYRSALAADNLQKMGYSHVISMDGGFRGWQEAGHAVAKD